MRNVFTSQNTGHYNNGSVPQTQSSYVMQQFPYGDQQQYNAQLYSNSQGLPQQTNHPSYRHNTEQPGYAQLYHSQRSILGRSVGYPRTYFSTGSDASGTSTPVYTNIQPAVRFGYPRSTSQQPPQQVVNPYIYQSSPSHTSVRFQSLAGPGAQSYVQQGQQSLSHQENHNNARTQSSPNQDIELQKEANAKRTADSIAQMRQNLLLEIIAQTEKESMRPAKRALNAQTGVGFDWGENFPRIGEVQSMCDRRQNTPPLNSPDIVADLNISESSSRTSSPHRVSSQKTSLPLTKIAEVIVAGKLDPILARLIGEHSASPNTPMSQSALQAIFLSPVTNTSLSTVNAAPSAPVTTQGNVIAANQNTSIFPGQNVHFGISSSVHKLASEITAGHFNPFFQRIQNQMNANVTPVQATSATPQYDSAQHQIVNPVAESPIVPSLLNQSAPPNQSSSSMPTVSQSVAVRQPGISREPASTQVVSEVVAPPLPVISCCLSLAVPDRVTASSGSTSLQKSAEQPQMQRGPSLGNYVTIGKRIDYVNDEDGKKDGEKETETNGDDDVVITLVTTKDAMRGPVEVIDVEDFIPSTGIKIKEEPEDHPTVIASTQNGTTPTAANNTPPVESGSTQSLSQESSTRINSVSGSPPMESGYMQSSPSINTLSGIPDADNGRTRSASQNSSANIDLLSQVVSSLTTTFYLHSLQRAASLTDSESSNDGGMSTPVEDQVEQAQITPTPSYIVKDLKVIASEALRKMARPAGDQDIFDQQGMFLVAKPVPNEAIPSPVQEAPSAEKSDSESCDYTSSSDAHVVHVPDKSAQPSKTSKKSGADLVKSLIKTREKIRNETIDFKRVFLQRLEKKFEKCLRKLKSFEEYSSDYVDQLLLESTYLRAKDASMESRDSQVQDSGRASVCESEESTLEQPHISVSKRQSVSDSNANSEADYEVVPNNPKAKQETHNNECLVSHNCNAVPLDDESQNVEYSKEESSPVASVEPQHEEDEVFIEPADLSMEAPSPVFPSPMSRLFSEEPEPGSEYEKQVQKETYYSINLRNEADDCLKPLKSYTAVESRGQIVHPDSNDKKEKDLAELMKSGVATGEKESDGKEQSGMRASGSCENVGIGEGRCGMVENTVRIEKRIDNRNVSTRKGHKRTENYNDRKRDGKKGIDGKRERLSISSSDDFQQSKKIKHSHLEKSLRQAMRELEHSSENSSEEEKRKERKKKLVEFKNKHGLDVKKMDESEKRKKVQQVMSMFNSTVSQHSPDSRGNSRVGSLDNVSQQRRHSPQTCPEINEPQSPKSPQDLHKTLRDGMNIVPVNQGRLDKNIKKDHNKLNNKEYPIITAKQGKSVKKRSKGRLHEIAKRLTLINSGHSSSIRRGSNVKEKGHTRMDVRERHASCTRPVNDESSKGDRIRQRSPVNADGSRQRSPVNADGSRQRSPVNADGSRQRSPVNSDGPRQRSPVNADGSRQRSPVNADGSRQRSPVNADGPRQWSPVNADGPRQRSPVNADGPRQRSPVNADGSRQRSPVNADGSRQWSPVNADGSRQWSPVNADGPRQWSPVNADGSRQRSPVNADGSRQRSLVNADCPRQWSPVNADGSRQWSPVNADGSRQRSPVNADGSRQRSPVNTDGSRQWSPVNADGSRQRSPVNADGSRQWSPVNADGSRQWSPVNADGSRQWSPVNADGSRQRSPVNADCPRQWSPVNADGSRQWSPVNDADGSRQWSPVNADGSRQWSPVNADGSRQRSPVNADCPRQWSPVNADGSRQWSPVNDADGSRQWSPVNADGHRQWSPVNADGSRQWSPVNADGSRQWSPVNADGSRQWSPVNDADGPRQWFPVNADGSRQRSPDTVMKRSQASNETTDITRHVNKRTTDTETTRRRSPETTLKRPNPSSGVPYEGAKKSRESFSQERRFEVHTKNVKLGEKSGVLVTSLGTLESGERPCKTGPAEIARQGPGGNGYPKQDSKKKADTSPSSRTDERTKNFMTSAGNQLDEGRPRISGHAVNAPRDSGQGGILKTGNETQLSDGRPVKEKGSVCNRPAKSPSSDGHSPPSSDGDSPSRSIWSVFQW